MVVRTIQTKRKDVSQDGHGKFKGQQEDPKEVTQTMAGKVIASGDSGRQGPGCADLESFGSLS